MTKTRGVAVFGLGKLGLPLAALCAAHGHDVVGVDPSARARRSASRLDAPRPEPGLETLLREAAPRLAITDDSAVAVSRTSMALIVVPTPTLPSGAFSDEQVREAIRRIGEALGGSPKPYDVVVVSTVMPGAMDGPIRSCLERAAGRPVGADLGLLYSPLFVALGSVVRDLTTPDVVLVGESSERSAPGSRLVNLWSSIQPGADARRVHRLPFAGAEVAKIAVNSFLTGKIAFANWIGALAGRHGAPANRVLAAIGADSRIGPRYLTPGMPFGGPCFPRDTRAMSLAADAQGLSGALPTATEALNLAHVDALFERVAAAAGGGKVAILGVSYKDGTAATDASPSLEIARRLQADGLRVSVHDPLARVEDLEQAPTADAAVAGAAAVLVASRAYRELAVAPGTVVIDPWGTTRVTFLAGTSHRAASGPTVADTA